MCELCDNILDKDKRGRIMVKKIIIHEEVVDVFHEKIYIPTLENFHFVLIMSGLLVQWNVERL